MNTFGSQQKHPRSHERDERRAIICARRAKIGRDRKLRPVRSEVFLPNISEPNAELIKEAFAAFPSRDQIVLTIHINDDDDPFQISSDQTPAIDAQLASLKSKLSVGDKDDEFTLTLVAHKPLKNHEVSIYVEEQVLAWLSSLTVEAQLEAFNALSKQARWFVFRTQQEGSRFQTDSIAMLPEGQPVSGFNPANRPALLERRNDAVNFAGGHQYVLIPDDLHPREIKNGRRWEPTLTILANAMAFAFMADYCAFEEGNNLRYKINGYKAVGGKIPCKELCSRTFMAAYKIYSWAYVGGATSDKLGLLRNILSLHLDENEKPQFDAGVLQSIRSGYEIYLKKNVAQYIDIKNKLSEFLTNLSKDAMKEVSEYGVALKQSLGALVTFFITVIIVKSVSTSGNGAIFDREITGLAYAAIVCSGIYLGVVLVLFNLELTRVTEKHGRIRGRYKDLLDSKDLDSIFEDNRELNAIIHDMEKRRNAVTIAWVLILISLGILTFVLGTLKEPAAPTIAPSPVALPTTNAPPTVQTALPPAAPVATSPIASPTPAVKPAPTKVPNTPLR